MLDFQRNKIWITQIARITKVFDGLGYTSLADPPQEGLVHPRQNITFSKDNRQIRAVFYEEGCDLDGVFPIITFARKRPDKLWLRYGLVDKTIAKRIPFFVSEFELAHESAMEAMAKKERAEAKAKNATYELQVALGITEELPYRTSKVDVRTRDPHKVDEPYTFQINISGFWTPSEMITIGRLLESMNLNGD
jgi:hypothetical protein